MVFTFLCGLATQHTLLKATRNVYVCKITAIFAPQHLILAKRVISIEYRLRSIGKFDGSIEYRLRGIGFFLRGGWDFSDIYASYKKNFINFAKKTLN